MILTITASTSEVVNSLTQNLNGMDRDEIDRLEKELDALLEAITKGRQKSIYFCIE